MSAVPVGDVALACRHVPAEPPYGPTHMYQFVDGAARVRATPVSAAAKPVELVAHWVLLCDRCQARRRGRPANELASHHFTVTQEIHINDLH